MSMHSRSRRGPASSIAIAIRLLLDRRTSNHSLMLVSDIVIGFEKGKMTEMLLWFSIFQSHNERAWFMHHTVIRSAV